MNNSNQNPNLSQLFAQLDEINNRDVFGCYLPVYGAKHTFRKMTVAQHRSVLDLLDVQKNSYSFFKRMLEILSENAFSFPLADLERLTLLDVAVFAIQNRIESLSDDYFDDSGNWSKLSIHLEWLEKNPPRFVMNGTHGDGGLTLLYSYPSIAKVLFVEQNTKIDINDTKSISSVLFSEMIKFVDEIQIKDQKYPFAGLSFQDRMNIIERLPSGIINGLDQQTRTAYGEYFQKFLHLRKDTTDEELIPLNAALYVINKR